jgi:hypothetical protein
MILIISVFNHSFIQLLCGAGDGTQGLAPAGHVLYQELYSSPEPAF